MSSANYHRESFFCTLLGHLFYLKCLLIYGDLQKTANNLSCKGHGGIELLLFFRFFFVEFPVTARSKASSFVSFSRYFVVFVHFLVLLSLKSSGEIITFLLSPTVL